jgi:hypothetical protein
VFACAVPLAAAVGYALATFQDAFRMMHLNSVFADWDSRMPRPALWVPTALVATLAAWVFYPRWNKRYTGREHCAVVGPLPLWLLGGTAALWAIRPLWTAPLHVGVAVDPVNGQAEPWGPGRGSGTTRRPGRRDWRPWPCCSAWGPGRRCGARSGGASRRSRGCW